MATINHTTYNTLTETFKDFDIYDGKNTLMLKVDGTSNKVTISPSGSNVLTITSTSAGVGTTAPTKLLHVAGQPRIDSVSGEPSARVPTGANSIERVFTNTDSDDAMGEPDEWLLIDINGTDYVIPAYLAP